MITLYCDSCDYTELTTAPRFFIGDKCPDCEAGHITTKEMKVALEETYIMANAEGGN